MKKFNLSEIQADAILDLKLRHLAKLEETKIRAEEDELNQERDSIETTLSSSKNLKNLVRKELIEDAEKYGDARRSKLVVREEAKAMREEEILPTEPLTIILSQQGWIRAAKGHDIDASALNYKAGDTLKTTAQGKSNQLLVVIDSKGRCYSLPAHKLPSARGQGEPLTSRLSPEPGATFESILIGEPSQQYLFASDAGYGFIGKLEDCYSKNKSGKTLLSLPKGSKVLPPQPINNIDNEYIVAATNEGRLLLFPLGFMPILARGKGNKIINISAAKAAKHEEFISTITTIKEGSSLVLISGKRKMTLSFADLAAYQGERGRRGNKLPRGLRSVDQMFSN